MVEVVVVAFEEAGHVHITVEEVVVAVEEVGGSDASVLWLRRLWWQLKRWGAARVHQGYTPGMDLVHPTRTRGHCTLRG